MEELKEFIWHVILLEIKNNHNTTEKAIKISSVYGQGAITDRQVWDWFSKFPSSDTSLKDKPRAGRSSCFKGIGGMQSVQKYSRIITWLPHILIHNLPPLEKERKSEWAGLLHTLNEKNSEDRIFKAISLFLRLRNYLFLKNIITFNKQCAFDENVSRELDWPESISSPYHKGRSQRHSLIWVFKT